jgi:hypothetical protein
MMNNLLGREDKRAEDEEDQRLVFLNASDGDLQDLVEYSLREKRIPAESTDQYLQLLRTIREDAQDKSRWTERCQAIRKQWQ